MELSWQYETERKLKVEKGQALGASPTLEE
jgi:hypothetical protein